MSFKLDSRSVFLPKIDTEIWSKFNLIWLSCFRVVSFYKRICDEQVMQLFIHDVNYIDNMTKFLLVHKWLNQQSILVLTSCITKGLRSFPDVSNYFLWPQELYKSAFNILLLSLVILFRNYNQSVFHIKGS